MPDVTPVADMPETDIAAGQIPLPEKAAPEMQAPPHVPPQAQGEAAPSIPAPAPAAPSQIAQNIQPAPSAAPSISEEALKANTKALETLSTQMERITGRMESFEKELGAERDARTHTMERMEKTITALQKDVGDLKKRPVAAAATAPAPRQQTRAEAPPPKTQPSAPPAAKKQPSRAPENASSGADKPAASSQSASSAKSSGASGAAASSQPRRQTTAASAAPGRWELRAAQPGRAWVSRAGSRDMQGVEVGQTLPGIGRITAITYQNGRWTVVGAQGRIEQ